MSRNKLREDFFANWLGDETEDAHLLESIMHSLDTLYEAGPDERIAVKAHKNLVATLEDIMPPTIYYDLIKNSPVGKVWVGINKYGLAIVDYDLSEPDFLEYWQKRSKAQLVRSKEQTVPIAQQINDYLNAKTAELHIPIDLSTATDFQRRVLEITIAVPRGQVTTYGEVARKMGKPAAYRAVGQALRRNPIPIVVPCHRVIASDGTLGGYGGKLGDARKIKLLKLEGVMLA